MAVNTLGGGVRYSKRRAPSGALFFFLDRLFPVLAAPTSAATVRKPCAPRIRDACSGA